ncbi:hypothetical protein E6C27_scaffold675G00530 [Cucumis melo var. makuwa]|uniref:RRM domain-containing protein n=1 Tax=Cucumis melo var. makuwa TaxID=1194695 RepID=A0A5A7U8Z4_CUCMM|nr:hypothetical protein E6C27_scaffold675G00530 [Cucumis melo var. makuwa]
MAGREEYRIFVGGLSWDITERQLENAFNRFDKWKVTSDYECVTTNEASWKVPLATQRWDGLGNMVPAEAMRLFVKILEGAITKQMTAIEEMVASEYN